MMAKTPEKIELQQQSKCIKLSYEGDESYTMSFEFLRVHSPSADVRGHGNNDAVLQLNKEQVIVKTIEPVGHYAIKLIFDDGHDTGLYSWDYLYELATNHDRYWQEYIQALADAGHTREVI